MANYDQNRGYRSYDDDRDWDMNRRRYRREDEYNRENYGGYGNIGYTPYREEKNWRREYEGEPYSDMRNVSYGDMYHGNVERREWETNQAQGGRYANRGMSDASRYGNEYGSGYGSAYRSGYYGREGRDYDDMRQRREGRDWWDRTKDEVKSWVGDDEAERRREMDKRMAGMHRGKGPRGYSRSDERIKEDVCERLSDDAYVDASDIDINVQGSEVILNGTVNSREEKHRAEDIAESISGVRNVENHLKVNPRAYDHDTYSRYDRDYTGFTDEAGGIGRKSGTTNEVIRDVNSDRNRK